MDKYIITEEEQETVKLYTARSLPDNPTERGMLPATIKKFFYKFLEPLFQVLNLHLGQIEGGITDALSEHDASEDAHQFILNLISDLQRQNLEQGTAITEHYSVVEMALQAISEEISSDISKHDYADSSHKDIRRLVNNACEVANNAYNLATGKSKIIPVKGVSEMLQALNDTLNVGDKFVLSNKDVPDFTLFEKNSTATDAVPWANDIELTPGESYIYNGYLLVASESGIDTSLFAKAVELVSMQNIVTNHFTEFSKYKSNVQEQLDAKENSVAKRTETAESVTLSDNTEFNLGLRTSVILNLPETVPSDYECIVNFRSGTTATSFDSPDAIIFSQDDCLDGKLYPVSNRLYEINIKRVGEYIIAKVGACDYAIL